ncbi:MAG: porin family protein [bacterium]|nr:porin family protein [bacterium]
MSLIRSFQPVVRALAPALALILFLFAPPLFAEEGDDKQGLHPYVEYEIGMSYSKNQTLRGASVPGLHGQAEPDAPGYVFGGAFGARFLEHFRTEVRVGYRTTEIEEIALQGEAPDARGDLALLSATLNGYVDWDFGIGVIPFIGAGIGWGMQSLDVQNQGGNATQLSIDDTDHVIVWNAMVGGTLPLTKVTELSLAYRYIRTEEVSHDSRIGLPSGGATPTVTTKQQLDSEFDAHEVYLSLRFKF